MLWGQIWIGNVIEECVDARVRCSPEKNAKLGIVGVDFVIGFAEKSRFFTTKTFSAN